MRWGGGVSAGGGARGEQAGVALWPAQGRNLNHCRSEGRRNPAAPDGWGRSGRGARGWPWMEGGQFSVVRRRRIRHEYARGVPHARVRWCGGVTCARATAVARCADVVCTRPSSTSCVGGIIHGRCRSDDRPRVARRCPARGVRGGGSRRLGRGRGARGLTGEQRGRLWLEANCYLRYKERGRHGRFDACELAFGSAARCRRPAWLPMSTTLGHDPMMIDRGHSKSSRLRTKWLLST